jgi:EAL domain-containing protein (putative c-di-GMP-specific phosphodiesterase class I)
MPDEFIPIAERTRLIKPLTKWVLKEAFDHCAQWHKAGYDLKVSVNLSAKDLHDPELPDMIAGIAGVAEIKPEWIILEITESSIMTDPERVLEIVDRLDNMGFEFSIDDFGTGYSSLAYLKKMPIKELKIDRSFVTDLLNSENDAVIVNATINLAHNLGMKVTAEGIENEETLEVLRKSGCDVAQGFHISKPISFADMNEWIKSAN